MADELTAPEREPESEKAEALDIVESVTRQNPRLFNGIDKRKKEEIVKAFSIGITQIQKSHSGPLPDPETLDHYNKIITNGAERIMIMAEKEQSFRHKYTENVAKRQLNQISKGQIFGFILALLGIGGGTLLAYEGKETTGLSVIITSIVALVGAFIVGKVQEKKN